MKKNDRKEFIKQTAIYTVMITSLIIFYSLYDFNFVVEFIYSNF